MKLSLASIALVLLLLPLSCAQEDVQPASGTADVGVAGSYARFIIVGNHMYIVDETGIKTFSLTDSAKPEQVDQQLIGERIESIFHFDQKLFIGSGAGLFIYQISADGIPVQLSATDYFNTFDFFACDPVVANDSFAYVTINTRARIDRPCGSTIVVGVNELRIYNILDVTQPILLSVYPMTAPKGVGLDGNILFICDDDQGLKIYDVRDPLDIQLIKHFDTFTSFDVIPLDGLLLVVGPDNVYQFDYSNLQDIKLISQIPYGA